VNFHQHNDHLTFIYIYLHLSELSRITQESYKTYFHFGPRCSLIKIASKLQMTQEYLVLLSICIMINLSLHIGLSRIVSHMFISDIIDSCKETQIHPFVLCTFAHLSNKVSRAVLLQVSCGREALGISKTPRRYWSSFSPFLPQSLLAMVHND